MKYQWFAALVIAASLMNGVGQGQDKAAQEVAQSVNEKIRGNDLDGALQVLDEAVEDKVAIPPFVRQQLAMSLLQKNRGDDAAKQILLVLESTYAELEKSGNAVPFASSMSIANTVLRRTNRASDADVWLEKGLSAIQDKLDGSQLTPLHGMYGTLVLTKARSMRESGKGSEGDQLMIDYVASCEKLLEAKPPTASSAGVMVNLWSSYLPMLSGETAKAVFSKSEALAQSSLKESPNAGLLQSYLSSVGNYASMASRTNPDDAESALASVNRFFADFETEDEPMRKMIEQNQKNYERISKSIESSRALLAMVGQPAPDLDPLQWVNGEPETFASLKGNVVLLDFWAVWCGPCIATFPHLKHLDQEFGPKGLKVIGVTRQYNFAWDDDKQAAARSPEPVTLDDELAMLKKFIAKYELTHRTMLTPEKSDMQSNYHVTGIPHAVVIDKKGLVRLVKVGSGEKNAQEIEAMIQQLLAE